MRLTKSTSHAIRILIDCAQSEGRLIKVAELSQRLDITQQNVFKIVNMLARAGLIGATRGRNGGVRLARPASDIRIGDVVRATEVTHVEIEDGTSEDNSAASRDVNRVLDNALGAFIEVLDQHTIADMAKAQRAPAGSARKTTQALKMPAANPRGRRVAEENSR
ncbi:MAG: Rrf2 family transcriptional regulator [Hyphomicrobiales bacterium]|nr:MAG: Rrf2 family transcriptional regulator [Hyphomicrobiales bacterium]